MAKPRKLISGLALTAGAIAYAYSTRPIPTITQQTPTQYAEAVGAITLEYSKLARQYIVQPNHKCYRLQVAECLDLLKPSEPNIVQTATGAQNINIQLKAIAFQVRTEAINQAKVESRHLDSLLNR